MRNCAKFRAGSNHCRDMAIFRFLKMAAARHLGFRSSKFQLPVYGSDGQYASS